MPVCTATKFNGVMTALITPFKENGVDWMALDRLIDFQIDQGIHGIIPCGTTGESATLSHEEHRQVIRYVVERVHGRIPIIAGTGSNSTYETIELTQSARQAGADGALLITPYYNKPTQEGLYQHYKAVSDAVPELPLVLYNVPSRTSISLELNTIQRLSQLDNIVSIKEATANMEFASKIKMACQDRLTLLSGDDATFLPFLAIGGHGVISVATNVAPAWMVNIWEAWHRGDWNTARNTHEALLKLNGLLFCETNPIPVKAAAEMLGLCGGDIRLPLTPLSHAHRDKLRQALTELGLIVQK
ncbi:MAG: 4-hydroxy-tetrahydrodipicolinate synthase [Magnetococcus sp. DMHC-6]